MYIRKYQFVNFDTKALPYPSWQLSYELSIFKDALQGKDNVLNVFCGYNLHAKVVQTYLNEWHPNIKNTDNVISPSNQQFHNMERYFPLDRDKPNQYDLIMSMGGLDRLSSFEQILGLIQNCYAQLKPNGRLVLTGTTPKTNPDWISRVLKQPILSHGIVVNGANSEYAEPQYADQNIILLDIEKETATPFNWDKIVNPDNISDFLSSDYLWGQNQDKDNAGRLYWVKYIRSRVSRHVENDEEGRIKVCEAGFGAGTCFKNLVAAGLVPDMIEYYGADVTPAFVSYAKENLVGMEPVLIDGKSLPYEDKSMDYMMCRHLLEHQPDYRPILREMCRVTAKSIFINLFIPLSDDVFDTVKFSGEFYHNHLSRTLFWECAAKCGFSATHLVTFEKDGKIDYIVTLDRKGI